MAKVKGPLMSLEASGTVGDTITFDKRGFVRQRVIPANPQTDLQGNTRQRLLAIQRGLTKLGAGVIGAVKTIAPTSYRWNSFLLQKVLGPGSSEYTASVTAFNALTSTQKTAWDTEAATRGLTTQSIGYATDADVTPGLALFIICRALFALGLHTIAGTPSGTNQASWGAYFVS